MPNASRKLLVLKSTPALPVTGADISMFERLDFLKRHHGWEGDMFSVSPLSKLEGTARLIQKLEIPFTRQGNVLELTYRGVTSTLLFAEQSDSFVSEHHHNIVKHFEAAVRTRKPGLIFANLRDRPVLNYLPAHCDLPHVFFLTEASFPPPAELASGPNGEALSDAVRNAGPIIVASNYLKRSFSSRWGIEPLVFLNSVNTDNYKVSAEQDRLYYTLVQPYRVKGLEIFLGLVRALPDRLFQTAGGFGAEFRSILPTLQSFPNLRVAPFQCSIRDVYARAKAVLVPSLCEEAFGRVVVEALASGTPVLAADIGALRETGGDAASYIDVSEPAAGVPLCSRHLTDWISELKKLDEPDTFARYAKAAQDYTQNYRLRLAQSLCEMDRFLASLIQR